MWDKVATVHGDHKTEYVVVDFAFQHPTLIINAIGEKVGIDWKRAGYAYPTLLVSSLGQVKSRGLVVPFGLNVISFTKIVTPYNIQFYLNPWVTSIKLEFWQNLNLPLDQYETVLLDFEKRLKGLEQKIKELENW